MTESAREIEKLARRRTLLEIKASKAFTESAAAAIRIEISVISRTIRELRDETAENLTAAEQRAQALRCPCHGVDDYCPCQNVPDDETFKARMEAM